ncbi:MAG: hypothetical protein M3Y87_14310 [Myxococcota bacterium]|nr:hypothetical protein [Myxococcota bacterium]
MCRRPLLAALVVFAVAGCAEGGGGLLGDAAIGSSRDGATERDGAPPRDSGRPTTCGEGQHACGGGCIDDLPNEPENGCRLGCGEPCDAPTSGTVSCSAAGTCDFTCTPPFRREGDDCVCAPRTCEEMGAMCGAPDDGCGMPLDCGSCDGGSCIDGRCACTPDAREPNDSNTVAPNLGSFSDSDDPPDAVFGDMSIDEMGDVDWVRFTITDGFDFGNPNLLVTLDQVPAGSTYALTAFFVCTSGGDSTSCAQGSSDNEIGRGCTASVSGGETGQVQLETECSGTDEGGSLFVRVRASTWGGACDPHRVTLRVR